MSAAKNFDYFFHTKPNLIDYFKSNVNPNSKFIGPLYDPTCVQTIGEVIGDIGIVFLGHYSPKKLSSLLRFAAHYKGTITVSGNGWFKTPLKKLQNIKIYNALYGSASYKLHRHAICSLGLLMESITEGMPGDEITSRTFLVPAYGGVLLHPRTRAAEIIFGENSELLYSSIEQAAETALRIKADKALRTRLAKEQQSNALKAGTNANDFASLLLSL
jgi:hypothetical protein